MVRYLWHHLNLSFKPPLFSAVGPQIRCIHLIAIYAISYNIQTSLYCSFDKYKLYEIDEPLATRIRVLNINHGTLEYI